MKITIEIKSDPNLVSDETFLPSIQNRLNYFLKDQYSITHTQSSKVITLSGIRKDVSAITLVPEYDIDIKTRKREVVQARQICHYLAKNHINRSLAHIGEYFGNVDHATVLHSCRTINNLLETNNEFKSNFKHFIENYNIGHEG